MEDPDRKNADEAKGCNGQEQKKAYESPELVRRGPVAKVAAATWIPVAEQPG